jgi:uncharacterized protein
MSSPIDISLSATDLSNHLACPHLTTLELAAKRRLLTRPEIRDPDLKVVQELGQRHEAAYVKHLKEKGLNIRDLSSIGDRTPKERATALEKTLQALHDGVDVILQAALGNSHWYGRADVLRKIDRGEPNNLGTWSYEPYDCKLTRHTKGETILQLAVYSELLSKIQGHPPINLYVVTPGRNFEPETYPYLEYSAYYEFVKNNLEKISAAPPSPIESPTAANAAEPLTSDHFVNGTYPEPCSHCDICRWFRECDARRRKDDHLSLVAGISRLQRDQLRDWSIDTMTALSSATFNEKPSHGSLDSYTRVREQAELQVQSRGELFPLFNPLPLAPEMGFYRLPAPSPHNVFIDFEGDPFANDAQGHQYLFGIIAPNDQGKLEYQCRWALTAQEEKEAFEWYVDLIKSHWDADPNMHVYHFGPYEPNQFKHLMTRYMTREDVVDRMLRARLFADLHSIFKQAIRAGVEEYSLKKLEIICGFNRQIAKDDSRAAMRYFEHGLELGWELDQSSPKHIELKNALEGYNHEDCEATAQLRTWLESQRPANNPATSEPLPRPEILDGAPRPDIEERQRRVDQLLRELIVGIPVDAAQRSAEQSAVWLLAHLLDLHHRELKVAVWESYRLAELSDDEAMDDPKAIGGLEFLHRVDIKNNCPIDRYSFPLQDLELRKGKKLQVNRKAFGEVVEIDKISRTIDIKKARKMFDTHPSTLHLGEQVFPIDSQEKSLIRLGQWIRDHGINTPGPHRAARDLLLGKPRPLLTGKSLPLAEKDPIKAAQQILPNLDHSFLAIQGPPGSGKTYNGAHFICDLARAGKKIGITALGHKVIANLFKDVILAANDDPQIRCMQVAPKKDDVPFGVTWAERKDALEALRDGTANIVGGTTWVWSREEFFESLDYLFIDEAGQMALGDVLAAAQAAKNLVLIGDPQQLERPLKASHPEGADISALEHILGEQKTMPPEKGLFLEHTHRLHPQICKFTSEVFYENKLEPDQVATNTSLEGHPWLSPGLWFVSVEHESNTNSSPREVDVVADIVDSLLQSQVQWFRSVGNPEPMSKKEIMIIAPYNLQVFDLSQRIPDIRIGTVDKFQGQQAAVVIYSLTTSSQQDVPHGMQFLYSLNRFNVATSRARTCAIVVGNPRLFEPECHTPSHMRLANAFCRFFQISSHHSND